MVGWLGVIFVVYDMAASGMELMMVMIMVECVLLTDCDGLGFVVAVHVPSLGILGRSISLGV